MKKNARRSTNIVLALLMTVSLVAGVVGSSASAQTTTTTTTAPTLTSVGVIPALASVEAGKTKQFTAIAIYSDSSNADVTSKVTWATSKSTGATISASGVATGLGAGNVNVTATLSGVTGTSVVTVVGPVSVGVMPALATLTAAGTQKFTAIAIYADGSNMDVTSLVTWASARTSTATVSASGTASGAAAGNVNITATLAGVSGTGVATVVAPVSIGVLPALATVDAGDTTNFTALAINSDGSNADITSLVTWASAKTTTATVSAGTVTGKAAASVNITATLSGVTGTGVVSVNAPTSVGVMPPLASFATGDTKQFQAIAIHKDGSNADVTAFVTWASSKTAVAAISSPGGLATGVAAGTANITASLSGVTGASVATVVPAVTLSSIAMIPPLPNNLAPGGTIQFTAIGIYTDGSKIDITSQVTWASSTTTVAVISAKGLVTGIAAGDTKITASLAGVTSVPAVSLKVA